MQDRHRNSGAFLRLSRLLSRIKYPRLGEGIFLGDKNLKPATYAVLVIALTTGSTYAATLKDCLGIEDPLVRVACYDDIVRAMDAERATDHKNSDRSSNTPNEPATKEKKFGLKQTIAKEDSDLKTLEQVIAEISRDPRGLLLVTLDNGQVWRQIDQAKLNLKPGNRIEIKAGFGGSFYLSRNGSRSLKVRRVR